MATQAPTALVNAGLTMPDGQKWELYCRAFTQAAEVFCQRPRLRPRGTFNNYFFDALNNLPAPNTQAGRALAAATAREVPCIVGRLVGTAASLVNNPVIGPACRAVAGGHARAAYMAGGTLLGGAMGMLSGMSGGVFRNCLGIGQMFRHVAPGVNGWRQVYGNGCRLRFPDGMVGNRTLEIKGPFDSYRPGQEEDYQTLNDPNSGFEASAEKCGKRGPNHQNCPR